MKRSKGEQHGSDETSLEKRLKMKYLSIFSGIEAATVAWYPLGWECVAVAEIEPFPAAVLAHHYPAVPNLGDVTTITSDDIAALGEIDLVVFGSPCQDLSVAGKRLGFNGERSGLFTTATRIVRWAREHCGCRFALWENVPGAFSSNQGRDFAVVVEQMAGCRHVEVPKNGWGTEGAALGDDGLLEWGTLDAQWFGVAQRRRRVFALADFGDWASRRPILLEPDSLRGDSPPSREARQNAAADAGAGAAGGGVAFGGNRTSGSIDVAPALLAQPGSGWKGDFESETFLVQPQGVEIGPGGGKITDLNPTLDTRAKDGPIRNQLAGAVLVPCITGDVAHTLKAEGFDASEGGTGRGTPLVPVAFHHNAQACQLPTAERDTSVSDALTCSQQAAVAFTTEQTPKFNSDCALTLAKQSPTGGGQVQSVLTAMQVRRLTPRECERLQGFPDDYTAIPWRKKPASECPDGPRYKALGNSMAVPVMRWIGRQIEKSVVANDNRRQSHL